MKNRFSTRWSVLFTVNFCACSTSDDNLLKNIELFDKLSLRFSGRVLFIKDVIGSSEICCWTFYGHGRKVAEVCCHSIVYTTDKKHTKVIDLELIFDTFLSHRYSIKKSFELFRLNSLKPAFTKKRWIYYCTKIETGQIKSSCKRHHRHRKLLLVDQLAHPTKKKVNDQDWLVFAPTNKTLTDPSSLHQVIRR